VEGWQSFAKVFVAVNCDFMNCICHDSPLEKGNCPINVHRKRPQLTTDHSLFPLHTRFFNFDNPDIAFRFQIEKYGNHQRNSREKSRLFRAPDCISSRKFPRGIARFFPSGDPGVRLSTRVPSADFDLDAHRQWRRFTARA